MTADASDLEGRPGQAAEPEFRQPAGAVATVLEPVARYASSVVGFFGTFAVMAGLAGAVMWLIIFVPFAPVSVWKIVAAILTAGVLMIPAAVLGVFWIGLGQLVELPARLADTAGQLGDQGRQALASISAPPAGKKGKLRRVLPLVRTLVDVRSLLMESRELMLQAIVLVRVANPIMLVFVLVSCVAGGVLILIAAVAGLLAVV